MKIEQITDLIRPTITALNYDLWGCEYLPQGKYSLLRIYIDKADGITVDDCGDVSEQISALLEVEDIIPGQYTLEVSSPGMDRILFTVDQFKQYIGHELKIRLRVPLDGQRKFVGKLTKVENDTVTWNVGDKEYSVLFNEIDKARLNLN